VKLLGIDVGSSSVKAAVLRNGTPHGRIVRAFFKTDPRGDRVEVAADRIDRALADAVSQLGEPAKHVDAIGLTVMSPAWCAMDARGKALTPVVTHQDRRSVAEAMEIEGRVGLEEHLALAGNRPFPGSIGSTTWAWYQKYEPGRLRKVDLVGLLNTYLHRQLTGSRVIDPSNASFTGWYATLEQSGWSEELCDATGVAPALLPEVLEADRIAGRITRGAARRFGLTEGTPAMVGMIDTSAAMLLGPARAGQLLDVVGSTDVLALCTDRRPRPHEHLLTRALGVNPPGRKLWMSVSTIAAAGSSLLWAREQLFRELSVDTFRSLVQSLARTRGNNQVPAVTFDPYLAGERASVEQRQAAFHGLTLATTREQMLGAIIESLARASADRLKLFEKGEVKIRRDVIVSGGAADRLDRVFQRDWPGNWRFRRYTEASLRGIGKLNPREG
jgi:xylulokinase